MLAAGAFVVGHGDERAPRRAPSLTGPPIRRAGWWLLWPARAVERDAGSSRSVVRVALPPPHGRRRPAGGGRALRTRGDGREPTTSDDLYRYCWDGRVQAAGIDPYRYPPDASELTRLREPWLWPSDRALPGDRAPAGLHPDQPSRRADDLPAGSRSMVRRRLPPGRHRVPPQAVAGRRPRGGPRHGVALLIVGLRRWRARPAVGGPVRPVPRAGAGAREQRPRRRLGRRLDAGGADRRPSATTTVAGCCARARRRDVVVGLLIGAAVLVKLYPGLLLVALAAGSGGPAVAPGRPLGDGGRWPLIVVAYAPARPRRRRQGPRLPSRLPERGGLRQRRPLPARRRVGLHGDLAAAASVATFVAVIAVLLATPTAAADRAVVAVRHAAARHLTGPAVVLRQRPRPRHAGRRPAMGCRAAGRLPLLPRRDPRIAARRRHRPGLLRRRGTHRHRRHDPDGQDGVGTSSAVVVAPARRRRTRIAMTRAAAAHTAARSTSTVRP